MDTHENKRTKKVPSQLVTLRLSWLRDRTTARVSRPCKGARSPLPQNKWSNTDEDFRPWHDSPREETHRVYFKPNWWPEKKETNAAAGYTGEVDLAIMRDSSTSSISYVEEARIPSIRDRTPTKTFEKQRRTLDRPDVSNLTDSKKIVNHVFQFFTPLN